MIVEDEFIVANDLRLILRRAGYAVCGIADSVLEARQLLEREKPDLVLLDIQLKGKLTGLDFAQQLQKEKVAFVFLSALSSQKVLEVAKTTGPAGFLVKPFREKDLLVTLDIAWYQHQQNKEWRQQKEKSKVASDKPNPVFGEMIGQSKAFLQVLEHITQVAPADTSVLILGESGTGKEQIANAIQQLSRRKNQPFIKVNCAALPPSLIESELFGHEKGAFTGAMDKRIGKFEQAAGGTILLDEIGELPLDMQVKLLRVLQEKEIERLGGKAPIKVDVRIIAATNRSLEKEIAEGRFRLDLYYRLHVFPLLLPPLRERKEDIPLLAQYFLQVYSRKIGKKVHEISPKVLEEFAAYDWPGNIRELEHVIERAILLAKSNVIKKSYLAALSSSEAMGVSDQSRVKTIEENERDHILAVLKKCNGKIWGEGGAAELLGVPPTTLNSKMKKLGIRKEFLG